MDLPNGIVSAAARSGSNGAVTFEFWATASEIHTWQRFGDFGSSNSGEDTSDSGDASDYVYITPNSGLFNDGLHITNHPANNAGEPGVGQPGPFPTGVETQVVAVYDHNDTSAGANGTMTLYRDGQFIGTKELHPDFSLRTLNDVNNWLGRSQWPDPVFDGSFNEFRIYDAALTAGQIALLFRNGPDGPIAVPEPGTVWLLLVVGMVVAALGCAPAERAMRARSTSG